MKNLEQIRAHHAFEKAKFVLDNYLPDNQKFVDEFLNLARKLPSMFQWNGLLATWAFLLAKAMKDPVYEFTSKLLLEHLRNNIFNFNIPDEISVNDIFTEHWVSVDTELTGIQLKELTQEANAISGWLKKAAEAMCDLEGE